MGELSDTAKRLAQEQQAQAELAQQQTQATLQSYSARINAVNTYRDISRTTRSPTSMHCSRLAEHQPLPKQKNTSRSGTPAPKICWKNRLMSSPSGTDWWKSLPLVILIFSFWYHYLQIPLSRNIGKSLVKLRIKHRKCLIYGCFFTSGKSCRGK